jgi:hypothetical protein
MSISPPGSTRRRSVAAARTILALALLCPALSGARAEPWAEGRRIEAITLPDQHGEPRAIDASVHAVLFSRDMGGGGVLKQALGDAGAALLERSGAIYVADVSRMPAMIRSLFAMPGLRRRGYPILIDAEGAATAEFPSEPERGTLVVLDDLRVESVRHFERAGELRDALEALAAAEDRK